MNHSFCKSPQERRKKLVFLIFHRKDLLYDIENIAYVQGDVMKTNDEHDRHQVIDIGQDGNVDRVTRILNLAYQECVDFLYAYTKADVFKASSLDNTFGAPEHYKMRLLVPPDFSKGTVALLKNLIHEYMTCRVIEDWMSITNPQAQPIWKNKLEEIEEAIISCMNARGGRIRRTQTPF